MANQADMAAKPRQQRVFSFSEKNKNRGFSHALPRQQRVFSFSEKNKNRGFSHALWKTRAKTRASSLV
ncbi:hypothetical protein A943_08575 [Bacillus sp. CPSM8]|nr:hypothetical protein A943_08575 [Bacillus sp. CPSM8]